MAEYVFPIEGKPPVTGQIVLQFGQRRNPVVENGQFRKCVSKRRQWQGEKRRSTVTKVEQPEVPTNSPLLAMVGQYQKS
ncbi:hypothetical protein [Sphingobium olei]|uniref:Uncharacterized protein n=1 Tax=Sphingobium olei TaxID=420955 RepID=A0ABW3P1I1_9SPHN|nr:hypothetical protein [Sphingobium sp.]